MKSFSEKIFLLVLFECNNDKFFQMQLGLAIKVCNTHGSFIENSLSFCLPLALALVEPASNPKVS